MKYRRSAVHLKCRTCFPFSFICMTVMVFFSSSPYLLNLVAFFLLSLFLCRLRNAFHPYINVICVKYTTFSRVITNVWKTTTANEVTNMWYILLIKNALKFSVVALDSHRKQHFSYITVVLLPDIPSIRLFSHPPRIPSLAVFCRISLTRFFRFICVQCHRPGTCRATESTYNVQWCWRCLCGWHRCRSNSTKPLSFSQCLIILNLRSYTRIQQTLALIWRDTHKHVHIVNSAQKHWMHFCAGSNFCLFAFRLEHSNRKVWRFRIFFVCVCSSTASITGYRILLLCFAYPNTLYICYMQHY